MSDEPRALAGAPTTAGGPTPVPAVAPASTAQATEARPTDAFAHLRAVFRSMRPRQWTKNLIVFMALLFSINERWEVSEPSSWLPLAGWSALTFALFCLISSADYLLNDVIDRESDRLHPDKRRRPIAAGLLWPRAAVIWAVALATAAVGGAFALSAVLTWHVGAVLAGYVVLMVTYTFVLKHVVLMDMMAIGAGFVLRAMAGALAIDTPISPWLYVVTALGALFLVVHKRRAEITLLAEGAGNHRPILDQYSPALLDQMTSLVTASTLSAYGLYTFTAENLPDNNAMMLTIPFVLYGIFRYLYLVHAKQEGGSPEDVLLRDVPLLLCIAGWVTTAALVLLIARE
jgi:4-hydroxybenzoate polyprenyltransferase